MTKTSREVIAEVIDETLSKCSFDECSYAETVSFILSALKEAGYVMVPVEPTEEMKRRGYAERPAEACWKAMISAATQQGE